MHQADTNKINELKLRIRQVNAQLTALEQHYGKNGYIVKKMYSTISTAYGGEDKTRFSFPKDASTRQLNRIVRAIDTIQNSAYINKKSREELDRRIRKSFTENELHKGMSDADIDNFFEYFKDGVFSTIQQITGYSSETIIDIVQSLHDSEEDFDVMEVLKSYVKNNNDVEFSDYVNQLLDDDDVVADLAGFSTGIKKRRKRTYRIK